VPELVLDGTWTALRLNWAIPANQQRWRKLNLCEGWQWLQGKG
jgi:hypothetical protein